MGSSSGRWDWRTSSEKRPRRSAAAQPARPLGPDPLACSLFAVCACQTISGSNVPTRCCMM